MSSGTPPAIVLTAASTIACGSMRRYLSRAGSSTQEASGSPSWSGTAAPPGATMTPATRPGRAAAANSAAEVPTSGDDVRRAQVRLGDDTGQKRAHRAWREEVVAPLGRAEAGHVDREHPGTRGERVPELRERV